jgi:hypothetical protein
LAQHLPEEDQTIMNTIPGRQTRLRALVLATTVTLILLGTLMLTLLGGARPVQARRAAAPAIAITSEVGTVDHPLVPGPAGFSVTVAPSNFTFDATAVNKPNQPGVGHWHVYVDAIDRAKPFSPSYVTFGATTTIHVTLAALARKGVTTGLHTLYVTLNNNDHSFVQPLATAATVIQLGPALHLVEDTGTPAHPIMIPATGAATFHVQVRGFTLDLRFMNKMNVPGTGHYHVYLDSIDPAKPFAHYITCNCDHMALPSLTFKLTAKFIKKKTGAGPGLHTLYVTLNNNDHSLFAPLTGDFTTVDIQR